MKDFFKTSSFKVLIIAVVVLLGLIIYTTSVGGSFLANLMGFVSTPMQGVSASVSDNITEFLDLDGMNKSELKALVKSLQDEMAQTRDKLVNYEGLLQENAQLKEQLKITESAPEIVSRTASVIGRDPNDAFYGFSIDQGTLAGISVGDPVITTQGLVGVVSQAYATTSKVTCLLSQDMKVAAMSKAKDESGVVESNVQSAAAGLVRLSYLSGETQLEAGDIITTTGAGNLYPKDLIIGVVQSVEKSETDVSKYAVIKPYEDLKNVKDVFVVTDFPGKGEEGSSVDFVEDPTSQPQEDPEGAQ